MTDSSSVGYVELAIQRSPANPPAAWFWQPETQIIGMPVQVRVGGSFVWPPPNVDATSVTNLILVAGGVGIKCVTSPHPCFLHAPSSSDPVHDHVKTKTKTEI